MNITMNQNIKAFERLSMAIESGFVESTTENIQAGAQLFVFDKKQWELLENKLDKAFVAQVESIGRQIKMDRAKELTEMGLADSFAEKRCREIKYCKAFSCGWAVWNASRWEIDEKNKVPSWIKNHIQEVARGESKLEKSSVISAIGKILSYDQKIVTLPDDWDSHKDLLGTPAGVVDLNTGELKSPDKKYFITKSTNYIPSSEANCPRWLKFLKEATKDDQDYIDYLQKVLGYCLSGSTREQSLFFAYGDGGNGKSVFIEIARKLLGDYSTTAEMSTFISKNYETHSTDLAALRGARLVTSIETEEGRAWAENKIKFLTGSDTISARFMRQDPITFKPEFKLFIAGNHAPKLNSVDDAIRRRFHVLPFVNKPKKPDPNLLDRIIDQEAPGVLRWMIEGCLKWQKEGLKKPQVVENATQDYFKEQNIFQEWLEECFVITKDKSDKVKSEIAVKSMMEYFEANGHEPLTGQAFGRRMQKIDGVKKDRSHGKIFYFGITAVNS